MLNQILRNMDWIIIEPVEYCPLRLKCLRCQGTMEAHGVKGHGIPVEALDFLGRGFQEIHRNCKV